MILDKQGFYERLCLAGKVARDFAAGYLIDELPEDLCFTIRSSGSKPGAQGPPGTIKFMGGRFLQPAELQKLTARRAASLLWVDGKVPIWINIGVGDYSDTQTEMMIDFCSTLVPANENELPPDYNCKRGNALVPFRIRGPGPPIGWRSVELDGRVPLVRSMSEHREPSD